MCRRLACTVNMDLMRQVAVKHNQNFTAVIKHVVSLEIMGILISQHLQRKLLPQLSRVI